MWGIGVGVLLGLFQIAALNKLITIITSEKIKVSSGVIITMLKMTLILLVFYLLAAYSGTATMLWCAGAVVITVVAVPTIKCIGNIRRYNNTGVGEK